ncbi:rhodanese-like domain-containing protein [Pseudodesulfovibrio sp. zrk46]|uniref:rhodanese-like domain-containing protein n=1 Tax=Pseudodesulfovibrio sp. zrk46 TaxID=2725288 RepID=UPI001448F68D|nr:rhodanese-like domain-containing protein [Pseudodesulfovibrio sp. zrk46]QJB56703.1 sulfurtransferase [Pseudodesulfovibrio sp. zrk46]
MVHVRSMLCIALAAILMALPAMASEGDSYPLRAFYPEVPYITTEQLLDDYFSTRVVDIRSRFEYDVARINRAFLLPLNDPAFPEKLERLRPKDDPTPLIFYCNGHTCAKSYQAAQLAISLGFTDVYVYDGGIFDWILAAPDKATLMGETPARPNRIISDRQFNERLHDYTTFAKEAEAGNSIVIDIRDPFQREDVPKLPHIRNIPLDSLMELVVSRIWTEKKLLFFDAVGKQVRWLQYFLESYGYFDYAFLDGGILSIADQEDKLKPTIETNRSISSNQGMLLTITNDERLNNSDRKALSFLLANVKFNNYIVVSLKKIDAAGISKPLILGSIRKLSKLGYAMHQVIQDTLIVQMDPRLAWKGTTNTKAWKDTVKEFSEAVGK